MLVCNILHVAYKLTLKRSGSLYGRPVEPMPMKKISKIKRPGTLQAMAYDKIKDLLLTGQLQLDAIYSANQFAEILGVSRTPVREALLQMAAEGLLIPMKGRGFKIHEFTKKEVSDFFETRKLIELYVINQLVGTMQNKDLEALEDSLQEMIRSENEGDTNGFLESDKTFHMYLVHLLNNRLLESIMENIRNLISIFGKKALSTSGRPQEVIREHEAVYQALQNKNRKKAVQSMEYHLNTTEKYLLENIY